MGFGLLATGFFYGALFGGILLADNIWGFGP